MLVERDLRHEQRFMAQENALNAAMLSAKEAVLKAEVSTDHRLALLNELRDGVATTAQIEALYERVNEAKARLDQLEGKGIGLSVGWGYLIVIASLALSWYLATR